ncbi:MAG: hypothetical protein N2115_08520 [bacterium]|nr:hypothetical protein [bacterium]
MLKFYKFLLSTILFLLPSSVHAEEIRCIADFVSTEFSESGEPLRTIFEGKVKVIAEKIVIECDKAIYDHIQNQLTIDSGVKFSQREFSLYSTALNYNFSSQTGYFTQGRFYYKEFYGRAGFVQKEKDKISADTCILTTCDLEKPHYHLSCAKIHLTEEKLTLKDLKVYLGRVPVFYFPKYSYSVKMREPLFSISGGYKTELGNGISLIFNNTSGKDGIKMEEKIDLGLQGIGAGIIIQDVTVPDTTSSIKKFHAYSFKRYGKLDFSYGFIGEFQNEFNNRQNVIADWRWMKDNKFFRRHLYDEYLEKSKNPNNFSYSRPAGNGILNVRIIDSAHENFLSPARIPEIEIVFPSIKYKGLLSSFDLISSRFVDREGNELTRVFSEAEFETQLNAGPVKIAPFVRFRNIFYSSDEEDTNNLIFSPGMNMQFIARKLTGQSTIYFSPSLSVYANYPSKKETNFSFDAIDSNPDGFFSSFNLAWDFWHRGSRRGNITMMNLYDISRTQFSDSIVMWNFSPDRKWSFYGQERFNFSKGGIREMTNSVIFNEKDTYFGIGNSYLSGYFDGISAFFSKKKEAWEYGFSLNYDIKKDKFTSQRYYIRKKIHCLTVGITYSRTSTAYVGIYIVPSFSTRAGIQ